MGRRSQANWLVALLVAGCSTGIALTDRGGRVHEVASADLPAGCRMVGDVSIGIPPDAARPRTEAQLVILMRNKAAEMGGTHVLVESREPRGEGSEAHFVGRGLAYSCPDEPASTEPTAGEPAAGEPETGEPAPEE